PFASVNQWRIVADVDATHRRYRYRHRRRRLAGAGVRARLARAADRRRYHGFRRSSPARTDRAQSAAARRARRCAGDGRGRATVAAGPPSPLGGHGRGRFLTEGDEGLPLSSERAPDFLSCTVMDNPGQIHLLAIGPLTNVALAFLREPQLPAHL